MVEKKCSGNKTHLTICPGSLGKLLNPSGSLILTGKIGIVPTNSGVYMEIK